MERSCQNSGALIALRNVFVLTNGTIRIGDFGLARKHEDKEYYRITTEGIYLPYCWMAPETFDDHKFTEKSDVWSFGVCLWELFTLGERPYCKAKENVQTFLKRGGRLAEPRYCHPEIYTFMHECWNINPQSRPKFSKCVKFFKHHLWKNARQVCDSIDAKLNLVSQQQKELENWARRDA